MTACISTVVLSWWYAKLIPQLIEMLPLNVLFNLQLQAVSQTPSVFGQAGTT